MKKGKSVDKTTELSDSNKGPLLLKCLEDLLSNEATDQFGHLIPNVITCLEWLISEDELSFKTGIDKLYSFFLRSSIYIQNIIVTEIRRRSSFVLCAPFCARFTSTQEEACPPKHLILSYIPEHQFDVKLRESQTFCFGKNSSFNLGVVSDDEVRESRLIGVPGVCETSMSDDHTLFLTKTGSVFGCGNARSGKLGPVNQKFVVEPLLIPLSEAPILGVYAANEFSVFVTQRTVYISGTLPESFPLEKGRYSKFYEIPIDRDTRKSCFTFKKIHYSTENGGFITIDVFEQHKLQRYAYGKYKERFRDEFVATNEFYRVPVFPTIDFPVPFGFDADGDDLDTVEIGSAEPFNAFHSCILSTDDPAIKNIQVDVVIGDVMDFSASEAGVVLRKSLKTKFPTISGHGYQHCRICLSGQFVNLNVLQLQVSPNGSLLLLATLTDSVNMPCLYRGYLQLMSSNMGPSSGEEAFQFPSQYHTKEIYHNKHLIAVVHEIPGTHGVRNFSTTSDGLSVIYTVDDGYAIDSDLYNNRAYRPEKWKSLDLVHLQKTREDYGLIGNLSDDLICCRFHDESVEYIIEDEDESILVPRTAMKLWCPSLETEGVKTVTLESNRKVLWNYLCGYRFILNNAISGRFVDSEEDVTLNVSHRSGHFSALLRSDVDGPDNALLDCILVGSDGVEVSFNHWWLSLQSMYFEVAIKYQEETGFPCFEVDYPGEILKDVVRTLTHPSYLFLLTVQRVCELIDFFDHYLMELLLKDCIDVLFFQVGESTLGYLFDVYIHYEHMQAYISEQFSENIHLLTMWKTSFEAPQQLLKEVQTTIDTLNLVLTDSSTYDTRNGSVSASSYNPAGCYSADTVSATMIANHSDSRGHNAVVGLMSTKIWPLFAQSSVTELLTRGKHCFSWELYKIENELKNLASNQHITHLYLPATDETARTWTRYLIEDLLKKKYSSDIRSKTKRRTSGRRMSEKVVDTPAISSSYEQTFIVEGQETVSEPILDKEVVAEVELPQEEPVSPLPETPLPSVWKSSGPIEIVNIDTTVDVKHGASRKFTSKSKKFHALPVEESTPSVAPWAACSSSQGQSFRQILADEQSTTSSLPKEIPKRIVPRKQRTCSWNQATESSPKTPSFAEIMADQELRSKPKQSLGRPLEFVVCEEQAIQQLAVLYREQAGDEVLVSIERIDLED